MSRVSRAERQTISIQPLMTGTVINDSKLRTKITNKSNGGKKRPSAANRISAIDTSLDATKLGLNDTSLQALV